MKNRNLLILCVITVVVIVAAAVTSNLRAPKESIEKSLLFPELKNRINDVAVVEIKGPDNTVKLRRDNSDWYLGSADDYPADFTKVRETVISISLLKLEEQKTDNPEFYSRLGVQHPDSEDAQSHLVTLKDSNGNALARIIVGKPRQSSASKPGLYVRKPDSKRSLLVEGYLDISDQNSAWFDQQLFDIPSSEIRRVRIKYPDGDRLEIYKETREQADYEILDRDRVPSAAMLIINRIANGLEAMRADDVMAAGKLDFFTDETVETRYVTFDGLVMDISLTQIENTHYARFNVHHDPSAMEEPEEIDKDELLKNISHYTGELKNRLSDWIYEIPDFKYEALTSDLDALSSFPSD